MNLSVSASLKPFFPFRDELSINNGIIMKGTRALKPYRLSTYKYCTKAIQELEQLSIEHTALTALCSLAAHAIP